MRPGASGGCLDSLVGIFMHVATLDVLKDLLGLIGGVIIIVPFFRDYLERRKRDRLRELKLVFTPFARAINAADESQTEQMERASQKDMFSMVIGIGFLIASFAISLWISATHGH